MTNIKDLEEQINKLEINKLKKSIKIIDNKKEKTKKNIPKEKNTYFLFMDDVMKIKHNKEYSINFPENRLKDIKTIINNNESGNELFYECHIFWSKLKDDEKEKYGIPNKLNIQFF